VSGALIRRWAIPVVLLGAVVIAGTRDRPTSQPLHQSEWLQAGDVTVRAVRLGRGDTTLVLLHGYGESLLSWRAMADRLGQRWRVVAIDLPGFGLSDKPSGPYDLESMRRRVHDFIARWTEGPVVIVGHSMGGEIAAAEALADTARIVAAILVSPAGQALGGASTVPDQMAHIAGFTAPLVLPVHDPAWLAEPRARRRYDPLTDPAYRASTGAVMREFDLTALRGRFSALRQPVLLVWGRLDPTIPFEIGEEIAAALPCGRFVPLAAAFHRPHQAQPDTVAAEIERFMDHLQTQEMQCAS
jgi:pimeloyl-ACP methyl ester carboxylesterase